MGARRLLVRAQERRLLVTARRATGFSLIELMIGLAIAATLLVMAAPNFATWSADGQIRAAAESIVSGMRYAQMEAIKRNAPVEFVLDPTVGTGKWEAKLLDGTVLQVALFTEGGRLAKFTTDPVTATTTTFTSLGGILPINADATAPLTRVEVEFSIASVVDARRLTVLVAGGRTGIKICDPAITDNTSPRFCTI
jgi:type IV fimbrial biogenesis protein FimT